VPAHIIEYWPMRGEKITVWAPACLSCGWHGGDGTRAEAEAEAAMHERGERQPWQLAPGQRPGWEGDPRSRPGR
jgi:hypothetical protein